MIQQVLHAMIYILSTSKHMRKKVPSGLSYCSKVPPQKDRGTLHTQQ
jgi:hypothetical protein